jgi:ABC-2 type transport system ATP-binding protein
VVSDAPALAVQARGLRKRYGKVSALDGLSVDVPRGAVFGLVGPNGAGKTTFIKTLLGIARPDDGEIVVLGGHPSARGVRAAIGYLPENLQIPGHLDAYGFLRSVARLKGLAAGGDAPLEASLRAVGLEEQAWRRRASGWSKGMRQRTGLAAALLGRPSLLVLDEPTDGIDPLGRAAIRDVIRAAAAHGTTVLLNSHLLAETEQICDRVAVLARGRIVLDGALDLLRATDRARIRLVVEPTATHAVIVAQVAGAAPELQRSVADDRPESAAFLLHGSDPAALSGALRRLIEAGLYVDEVVRPLRTLEDVMRDAILLPAQSETPPQDRR